MMVRQSQETVSTKTRRPYAPRLPPAKRRKQLLDAALEIVLTQGYAGVSIEAIARIAGVSRPVVYDHFTNLAELIEVLIEREQRYAMAQLAEVAPDLEQAKRADLAMMMNVGIPSYLEAVRARPETWRLILLPLEGTPEIVRERVESNLALVRKRIQDVIVVGIKSGRFKRDVDAELAAQAIMAVVEDAARKILTDPDAYSPERYAKFIKRVTARLLPA